MTHVPRTIGEVLAGLPTQLLCVEVVDAIEYARRIGQLDERAVMLSYLTGQTTGKGHMRVRCISDDMAMQIEREEHIPEDP